MQCKRCLRNGVTREGGILGLCWKHQNRKCQICSVPSDGEEMCINCSKAAEIKRMEAEANHILMDADHERLVSDIRRERLQQAKFHAHRSVDILFRGLVLSMEAIWGDLGSAGSIKPVPIHSLSPSPTEKSKKAA